MESKFGILVWVLACSVSVVGSACGGSAPAPQCSLSADGTRPRVQVAFEVEHTNMDDDPPRPKVSLVVRSPKEERVALGEFTGKCSLLELGVPPADPVYGAAIAELRCTHGKRAMHARVVHQSPTELVVRRFEMGDEAPAEGTGWAGGSLPASDPKELKGVRDVATLSIPQCPRFSADLVSPDKPL
jgi:hypothetical protein